MVFEGISDHNSDKKGPVLNVLYVDGVLYNEALITGG
jgi:hypothetical protein